MSLTRRSLLGLFAAVPFAAKAVAKSPVRPCLTPNKLPQFIDAVRRAEPGHLASDPTSSDAQRMYNYWRSVEIHRGGFI